MENSHKLTKTEQRIYTTKNQTPFIHPIRKAKHVIRNLFTLLSNKSPPSPYTKRLLYTSTIRSTLTYAAPVLEKQHRLLQDGATSPSKTSRRLVTGRDPYTRIRYLHNSATTLLYTITTQTSPKGFIPPHCLIKTKNCSSGTSQPPGHTTGEPEKATPFTPFPRAFNTHTYT